MFKREEEGKARVDGLQKADDESLIKSLLEGGCDKSAKEESDCIFYIPELGYGSTHLLMARVSDWLASVQAWTVSSLWLDELTWARPGLSRSRRISLPVVTVKVSLLADEV